MFLGLVIFTATATRTFTPTATPVVFFNNASFNYDGDGKRVKSVESTSVGTTTTYFVGGHFELTGAESTKYYFAGSTRIAMRKGTTLYYLLSDHLGSTSIVTDASGNKVSEMRYKACPQGASRGRGALYFRKHAHRLRFHRPIFAPVRFWVDVL